jgi:YegS/Rv2252/BmrU family lipid kinase
MTEASPRIAALIVNAKSRKGQALFREACRLLKDAGFTLSPAHAVHDPSTMPDKVKEAVAAGARLVIVGGGDGSISCAVDHLVGSEAVLGVLPLGTANSFARTLGIPLELPGAVGVIARGAPRTIDLGMIDGDYFANCATIGIAPQIAETVPHGLKAWLGRPGYLVWAALQLLRFQPFHLTIGKGDTAETLEVVEVRIANGPYHGGVELVDEAGVDSGRIAVQVVTGETRRHLVWNWILSVFRRPARKRSVRTFEGESIRLSTDTPMPISIDGEVLAETPVTACIARRAIRVMAPDQA